MREQGSKTGAPVEWASEVKALIEEVKATRPQEAPFPLHPWATVIDPAKFHASVLAEIERGPGGARAITGVFAEELRAYAKVIRGG
jgi:hypothetical protein